MAVTNREQWDCYEQAFRKDATMSPQKSEPASMLLLIEKLRSSGDVSHLWPLLSMRVWLSFSKSPTYNPNVPFFSIHAFEDNTFGIQCFKRIGQPSGDEMRRSLDQTVETFWQLAETL